MTRHSPSKSAHTRTALRPQMATFLLTASAILLSAVAIVTNLLLGGSGAVLVLLAGVLAAVVFLAWSLRRAVFWQVTLLRQCTAFIRMLASGNSSRHEPPIRYTREWDELSLALNELAACLECRQSHRRAAQNTLAAIIREREHIARQAAQAARLTEQVIERIPDVSGCCSGSSDETAEIIERLKQSATLTADAARHLAAAASALGGDNHKLQAHHKRLCSSSAGMTVSLRGFGSHMTILQDGSYGIATATSRIDAALVQVETTSRNASALSEAVTRDAQSGHQSIQEAIAGMQAIASSSSITSETIQSLSNRLEDIGGIASFINEVAEQTDLLALNATIIAAQAGEYGKGFAVVADEIRELAERTSSSTREIAQVIRGIQNDSRRAADAISQTETSVAAGLRMTRESGAAIEKIVSGIRQLDHEIARIATAATDQTSGGQAIHDSLQHIDEITQRVTAISNEITQTGAAMPAAIEGMKTLLASTGASIAEQSAASSVMARATRDGLETITALQDLCSSHSRDRETVAGNFEEMRASLDASASGMRAMDTLLQDLEQQLNRLETEIAGIES